MTNAPISDDELLRQIEAAENTIAVCDKNIKRAKADLLERRAKEIQALLKAKEEPYGDVSIIVGNRKVKINTPKKVSWDDKALAAKREEIIRAGDSPDVYIKTEYSISEAAYKGWPKDVQDFFAPARTVTPGNMSLKIVEEKE